jgi:hypothetical protein
MYSGLMSERSLTPGGKLAYSDHLSGGGMGTTSRSLNIHTSPEPRSTAISMPMQSIQHADDGKFRGDFATTAHTFNGIRVQIVAGRVVATVIKQWPDTISGVRSR